MKSTINQIDQNRTDKKLLSAIGRRDERAFKELYDRYWEPLYVHAHKVLGEGKASEDVVQEVFVDLWLKGSYNHIDNFQSYIFKSVKYKTLMALRKNRIEHHHLEEFKSIRPSHSVNHEIKSNEFREQLIHHLNKLPPRCREVFYKSRFEHFNNQEIADQLNISKRTVETHISHALRHLKRVKELLMIIIWIGS